MRTGKELLASGKGRAATHPDLCRLDGFFKSYYEGADGLTKVLASTQFQPLSARRALPCFDEPQLRAKFNLTITTDQGTRALSNMPVLSRQEVIVGYYGSNAVVTQFEVSPPMPTYLFAWMVAPEDDLM